ncbi:unnamed protein product [Ambrosiozyma monospora]|uniref:Unnamed protein product n=1 Tax=Ambrosiozyma monospora TaxID=43982 RepID=A0ACB5T0D9_AMBMO|nr:unnamed protein product [Ambrosiozyma monospora]
MHNGTGRRRMILVAHLAYFGPQDPRLSDFLDRLININEHEDFEFEFTHLHCGASVGQSLNQVLGFMEDNILDPWNSRKIKNNAELRSFAKWVLSFFNKIDLDYRPASFLTGSSFSIKPQLNIFIALTASKLMLDLENSFGRLLRSMNLNDCTITTRCLSSLPKSVTSLCLVGTNIFDHGSQFQTIRLPPLRDLKVKFPNDIPKISNCHELTELKKVSLAMNYSQRLGGGGSDFGMKELEMELGRLKTFIHDLTPAMRSLSLDISFGPKFFELERFPFDKFLLKSLFCLESFKMKWHECLPIWSLSVLPPSITSFRLKSFERVDGHLPSSLRSLEISYSKTSFADFWNIYLLPLRNLLHLTITFHQHSRRQN